jgi:NADPH:quinone reductase-like Zn-dependent oxidoreductase
MTASTTMRGLRFDPRLEGHVELAEGLARPTPRPGEVLVRVSHSTVNGHEFHLARDPLLRGLAWLRGAPGEVRTGLEFAGTVASPGARTSVGQRVVGYVDMVAGWRPHAEFVAIDEACIAPAPTRVSAAVASALPMGGSTAVVALRDLVGVQEGQRVLVVGASGGVGVLSVQLARHLGARVTAVARSVHHEALQGMGAHAVVEPDADLQRLGPFDAVLDWSARLRWSQVRRWLGPQGVFVPADPVRNLADVVRSRRARWLMVDRGHRDDLEQLVAWVDEGHLQPVVGEVLPLSQWERAVSRSQERGHLGRTVLAFEG